LVKIISESEQPITVIMQGANPCHHPSGWSNKKVITARPLQGQWDFKGEASWRNQQTGYHLGEIPSQLSGP
jgi:hypothetical protein